MMSKKLTIICFALLALSADFLSLRQTVIAQQETGENIFLIVFSQGVIAFALLACILLFAGKIRLKQS